MILDGNWQDALEPIAKKNFNVGLKEIPAEKSMLFDVVKSDKLTETYLEIGDVGSMEEFNGSVAYDDISQGYKMTVTAKEMAKGIKIQRRFVRTDQLDIVKSLPKMLGLAARRRIALDVFYGYNNAFNSSITTLDTLSLCNSSHTSTNGGSTQGNAGSTAFSGVSVEATRLLMKKFLSNTDQRFEVMPDMLIVPPDLEEAAYELTSSSGKVDTANNNKNFHQGKWKVLVSDWLEDTNNWFMVDSDLLKQFAVWNDVDSIDFAQSEDFDGIAAKYRAYMFYGFGFRDWRFMYGHAVS